MSKIRVGIETSVATFSNAGTARYAVELLTALQRLAEPDLELVEIAFGKRHQFVAPGWRRKLCYLYWEQVYCRRILPQQIERLKLDVFHATIPIPLPSAGIHRQTQMVTTIHDLIAFSNPEWFSRAGALRTQHDTQLAVRASRCLIANSCATEQELIVRLAVPKDQVVTIYPGKFTPAFPVVEIWPKQPIFVSVGTLEPRKNLITTLRAYRSLKNRVPDPPKLVLVGGKGWGDLPLEQVIRDYDLQHDVVIRGYVSDTELVALYSLATALIYPSLCEGFGLPILEGMTYGCPVITSNVSSLPEIAGDAAILVNPYDVEELYQAMNRIIIDTDCRRTFAQRGRQRAAQFSWEKCAIQTATVYHQLALNAEP